MNDYPFFVYLLAMAGVTYLIRMLPLVLFKKKIENKFILSFLYYIPFAVLTVMTIPAVFTSTAHVISAVVGFIAALITAWHGKSLPVVAAVACSAVLIYELIGQYLLPQILIF
jgi:branched-subunit amino acid transport protein